MYLKSIIYYAVIKETLVGPKCLHSGPTSIFSTFFPGVTGERRLHPVDIFLGRDLSFAAFVPFGDNVNKEEPVITEGDDEHRFALWLAL